MSILTAIKTFIASYPGGSAALLTVVVGVAARFGLHVTVNELTAIMSVCAVLAGLFTHKMTVPKAKLGK